MDTLQRARDIAADTYVRMEEANLAANGAPDLSAIEGQIKHTDDSWRDFIASYAHYMRKGCYDEGLPVQIALAALKVPA